jgi:hypothetical protein
MQFAYDIPRTVRAAVVHQYQFPVGSKLVEDRRRTLVKERQAFLLVENRYHY